MASTIATKLNIISGWLSRNLFLPIFLLAAFLRLYKLPTALYATTSELFRDLNVLHDMYESGHLVLLGPIASMKGFYFGAIYYYILFPFAWLTGFKPYGIILASGVFSLATLVLTYFLVKTWFNKTAALITTLLMSLSMYDIQNSYMASNPNFMPFFIILFFYVLTLILHKSKSNPGLYALLGLTIGILTQLHATALLIVPLSLIAIFVLKKIQSKISEISAFVTIVVLTYLPYVIYETTHDFANLRRIMQLGGQTFGLINFTSILNILQFINSVIFFENGYIPLDGYRGFALLILPFYALFLFLIWYYGIRLHRYNLSVEPKIMLLTWIMISFLVFMFYQGGTPPYYFLILWPIPILLLGWALSLVAESQKKVFVFIIIFYAFVQSVQLAYFFPMIDHPELTYDSYQDFFAVIKSDAGDKNYNIINASDYYNQLKYYMNLSGTEPSLTRANSELIYLYVNPGLSDYQVSSNYQISGAVSSGSLQAIKFTRTP